MVAAPKSKQAAKNNKAVNVVAEQEAATNEPVVEEAVAQEAAPAIENTKPKRGGNRNAAKVAEPVEEAIEPIVETAKSAGKKK